MQEQELPVRLMRAARAQLGEREFDAAWNEGRALTPQQAIEYALQGDE